MSSGPSEIHPRASALHARVIDVATGAQRPLLAGSGSYFSPRWSPDGNRLAYVAAEGGAAQLYVRWMSNGESVRA